MVTHFFLNTSQARARGVVHNKGCIHTKGALLEGAILVHEAPGAFFHTSNVLSTTSNETTNGNQAFDCGCLHIDQKLRKGSTFLFCMLELVSRNLVELHIRKLKEFVDISGSPSFHFVRYRARRPEPWVLLVHIAVPNDIDRDIIDCQGVIQVGELFTEVNMLVESLRIVNILHGDLVVLVKNVTIHSAIVNDLHNFFTFKKFFCLANSQICFGCLLKVYQKDSILVNFKANGENLEGPLTAQIYTFTIHCDTKAVADTNRDSAIYLVYVFLFHGRITLANHMYIHCRRLLAGTEPPRIFVPFWLAFLFTVWYTLEIFPRKSEI